jgi:hypothetical protein
MQVQAGGLATMQENDTDKETINPATIMDARDCLQLLVIEFGDTHIDTLAQLIDLTKLAEIEFSHICARRLC